MPPGRPAIGPAAANLGRGRVEPVKWIHLARDRSDRKRPGRARPLPRRRAARTPRAARPPALHLHETARDPPELMQPARYRNVPLPYYADILQGVIRPQDILKYLAEAFPEELLNLPPRPPQTMNRAEGG